MDASASYNGLSKIEEIEVCGAQLRKPASWLVAGGGGGGGCRGGWKSRS